MVSNYEQYFQYRWLFDKNLAISSIKDHRIMSVIPENVKRKIYQNFLFVRFIRRYSKYFDLLITNKFRRQRLYTRLNSIGCP